MNKWTKQNTIELLSRLANGETLEFENGYSFVIDDDMKVRILIGTEHPKWKFNLGWSVSLLHTYFSEHRLVNQPIEYVNFTEEETVKLNRMREGIVSDWDELKDISH